MASAATEKFDVLNRWTNEVQFHRRDHVLAGCERQREARTGHKVGG
jgi:hypothetical protein